ncbi:MAG: VCBS domain-containing protein, partial [Pseudomonadota bacterium]
DYIDGDAGDDSIHHIAALDDDDRRERYDGGTGNDTVFYHIDAETLQADIDGDRTLVNELLRVQARMDELAGENGEVGRANIRSDALGLQLREVENIRLVVDGEVVEVADLLTVDNEVFAADDAAIVGTGESEISINVAANDTVEDGVAQVTLVEEIAAIQRSAVSQQSAVQQSVASQEADIASASVDENGNVVVTVDEEARAALAEGETRTVNLTYEVTDTDGDSDQATVSVEIVGTNDGPVAEAVAVTIAESGSDVEASVSDMGASTVLNAGAFYVLDVDTGELTFVTRGVGALTIADVAPDSGLVVYVNANSSNYAIHASYFNDGIETAVDPSQLLPDNYDGEVLAYRDGLYLSSAAADLSLTVSAQEIVTDAGPADISITLSGMAWEGPDGPIEVQVGATTATVQPSDLAEATIITPAASDIDNGAVLTFDVDTSETLGTVQILDNGTFAYSQGNAFAALAVGETAQDTFTYTVTDEHGASATETVTVTIEGGNDAPVAEDIAVTVAEATSYVRAFEDEAGSQYVGNNGYFYVIDHDTGEMSTVVRTTGALTAAEVAPENGVVIQVNPNTSNWFVQVHTAYDGDVTVADPAGISVAGYDGETLIYDDALYLLDTTMDADITVSLSDIPTPDGPANLTFTLTDVDYIEEDPPISLNIGSASVDVRPGGEEGADMALITAIGFDPDASDVVSYYLDTSNTLGNVVDYGDGTFGYSAGGNFDDLTYGETATDTFLYIIEDEHGATDTATVTVTIEGIDGPRDLVELYSDSDFMS